MRFTVANMTMITQTEIHLAFGFQEFLTNVGGFLGLYVGCSLISIFEIFYFFFMILHQKLAKRKDRVGPIEVKIKKIEAIDKTKSHFENDCNQNKGLTLAEIFNLEEFLL
jgi:uncharacterized membrane protein